ncbi:MAG: M56 family metallopeptidase [Caulobacteraceae bacterium]
MATELFALTFIRVQAAACAAVLLVLLLRRPVRQVIGAGLTYRLWLLVPVAIVASLFPSLSEIARAGAAQDLGFEHASLLLCAWLGGAAIYLGVLVSREAAFRRLARRGKAGPAVMGVLWPRLVLPSDFAERFNAAERQMVHEHERTHVAQGHPQHNLIIGLCQTLAWFNPLIHVASMCARLDQELACDAVVIARRPSQRRIYAEALVKAHATMAHPPLACLWSALGSHPLLVRVDMLKRSELSEERYVRGAAAVTILAVLVALGTWITAPRGPQSSDFSWQAASPIQKDVSLPALSRVTSAQVTQQPPAPLSPVR